MKNTQKNAVAQPQTDEKKYTVANSLVSYYLVMMFGFFPLFLTNQYAHARTDKFWLYTVLTLVLIISVGVCAVINLNEARRLNNEYHLIKPLTVTDIMMLCFWGFAVISTFCSEYMSSALTGFSARDNGLLLLTLYMLMYFALTRHYQFKGYVVAVYLIISSVVALLTVLNFFYIDPLGMLSGYDKATIDDFGSTIGNKNIIAAFMCMSLPAAIMSFIVTKDKVMRIVSGVSIAFAYMGLICADSTSDILGLIVILPVTAIFSARGFDYLRRFMLAMAILFASGKLLQLFSAAVGDNNKGFEFMQKFLVYSPVMYVPMIVFGILYAVMYFVAKNREPRYPAKTVQTVFGVLFALGITAAIGLFIYFSFVDKKTDLGEFEKLLRFSDKWGTHRGFMWRVSLEEYGKFGFFGKLFGSGPDTAYYVLMPHFEELLKRFGDKSTDCAHNELLNYLITQGALGLIAYLGFMGSVIVRGIKAAKSNPFALAFVGAVICYLAQSVVNLYNPIVTPLLFIFASLAEALCRNGEEQIELGVRS